MRMLLGFLLLVSAVDASAARYGRDERIFTCKSSDRGQLPAGEKYQVHIAQKEALMITRLSDNKSLLATYASHSSVYLFEINDGDLLAGKHGYISNWGVDYSVSVSVSRGTYDSALNLTDCQLEKVITEYDPLTDTEIKLEEISDNADVGNGSADFTRFSNLNLSDEKKELIAEGKRWEQCTWEMVEGLPKILSLIGEHAYDEETVKGLQPLLAKPGFTHAIAYVSDDDISCSNTIVRMYSTDGIRLELFYSLGD